MLASERAETVESSGTGSSSGAAASLQSSDSTSVEIAIAPEAVDPAVPGHECVVDPALPLDECVICFAELDSAERRRLECGHVFCEECITSWCMPIAR